MDVPTTTEADSESEQPRTPVFTSIKKRYDQNREFDAKAPWREWLRERYAKQWYAIGCVALDVMLVWAILDAVDLSQVWPYLLCVAIILGLGYLEIKGLQRFWPPKLPR